MDAPSAVPSAPLDERTVAIPTADGVMRTFVAHPAGAGPFPVVLVYMDGVGYRDELIEHFARRYARNGYCAVLPDLYYRDGGPSFDPVEPFHRVKEIRRLAFSLDRDRVIGDTAAVLGWLPSDPAARTGAMGCVGYCMGGHMALLATGTFPDTFVAAASLYGGRSATEAPDSPHRVAMGTRGEIFLAYAERDRHIPDEQVARIDADFRAAGVRYTLVRYAGTEHGFSFPLRFCYHHEASEASWARVLDLFRRRLGEGP